MYVLYVCCAYFATSTFGCKKYRQYIQYNRDMHKIYQSIHTICTKYIQYIHICIDLCVCIVCIYFHQYILYVFRCMCLYVKNTYNTYTYALIYVYVCVCIYFQVHIYCMYFIVFACMSMYCIVSACMNLCMLQGHMQL